MTTTEHSIKYYLPLFLLAAYLFCAIMPPYDVMATEVPGLETTPGEKALVIYYSRTGNTRIVAETIRDSFSCGLQKIEDMKDRSGFFGFIGGMIDVRKNPITTINPPTLNLADYDLLFIGSPIWGMKCAPAITTFLQAADFTSKKVVLFVTTSSRMKDSAFDEYSKLIHTKGGTVIDTFFIKTLWKDSTEIKEAVRAILTGRQNVWMENLDGVSPRK